MGYDGWSSRWVSGDGKEVTSQIIRITDGSSCARTYLWRAETFAERPPKEDAIVLNSTCLISGFASSFDGSL